MSTGPQTRVEPLGRAAPHDKPAVLPGLPGGPPLMPGIRPVDREVPAGQEGELVIFDGDDVVQALRQFEVAGGTRVKLGRVDGNYAPELIEAMKTVMMFTLSIAAINLDVKPATPEDPLGIL